MNLIHPVRTALREPAVLASFTPSLQTGNLQAVEAQLLRLFERDTTPETLNLVPIPESRLLGTDYEIAKYLSVDGTVESCTPRNAMAALRLIEGTEGPAVSTVIRCSLGVFPSTTTLRLLAASPRCREKLSTLAPWGAGPCASMATLVRAIRWSDPARLTELMRAVDSSGLLIIADRFFKHVHVKDRLSGMETIFGAFVETTIEFEKLQDVMDVYLCFIADASDCDATELTAQCANALLRAVLVRLGAFVKKDVSRSWMGLHKMSHSKNMDLEVKDNPTWNHLWHKMIENPGFRPQFTAGEAVVGLNVMDKLFPQINREPDFKGDAELSKIIFSRRFCTSSINNYMSTLGKEKGLPFCASKSGLSSACFRPDFRRVLPSAMKRLLRSVPSPKEVSAISRAAWNLAATNEIYLARDCMSSSFWPVLTVILVIGALLADSLSEHLSLLFSANKAAAWAVMKAALTSMQKELANLPSRENAIAHRFCHVECGWGDAATAGAILQLARAALDAGEVTLKSRRGVTESPEVELPSPPVVKETTASVKTPAKTINRCSILPTGSSHLPLRLGWPALRAVHSSPCVKLGQVHVHMTRHFGVCRDV